MATGQTIVSNALITLGIVAQGASPSTSDSNDALTELNSMWDGWSIDEGFIYSVLSVNSTVTTTVGSYTIGTGGAFNVPRPTRIYKAVYSVSNNRNTLQIIDASTYYEHNDLTAAAATPDQFYFDANVDASGYAKVYLWPVPTFGSGSPVLELEVGVPFSTWTLGGNYLVPYGFQDAINYALAWRLIPRFGVAVNEQIAAVVAQLGQKAEARIREMNSRNRLMPMQSMMSPGSTPPPAPHQGA